MRGIFLKVFKTLSPMPFLIQGITAKYKFHFKCTCELLNTYCDLVSQPLQHKFTFDFSDSKVCEQLFVSPFFLVNVSGTRHG